MRFRLGKVGPLLFCSGACALVYQVAWLRELRLVFGASTAASAAVLGVFMGGLGLGGLLLGKRADREKNPLLFYANLEILVALASAATPLLVWLARTAYLGLGGQSTLGMFGATVARLVLGALVLIVPTTLMGGTMPAAARAVADPSDPGRRSMSVLYGVNTLGAVLGALAANFVMLEVFGTKLTLWMTCLFNVLVGLVGRMLSRDPVEDAAPAKKPAGSATSAPTAEASRDDAPVAPNAPAAIVDADADATATDTSADEPTKEGAGELAAAKDDRGAERPAKKTDTAPIDEDDAAVLPASLAWFPIAAAGVVGFAFLLMELVWYRMLAPLLGGSSYTFGLILAVALLGIGIGGALYGTGKAVPTLRGFAFTCGLEAFLIAIPFMMGDKVALLALGLRPLRVLGFGGSIASWAGVCALVVFPAAVVSGAQFPLVIGLFGKGQKSLGKHIGVAYLANTIGAIVGSLSGGFGLMPALTAPGCWRLVVAMLAGFGLVALFLSARHEEQGRRVVYGAGLTTCLASFLVFVATGPTAAWRHSPIGAGRVDSVAASPSPNEIERFRRDAIANVEWERDGLESTVGLGRTQGTSFIVNGKTDGNSLGDAPTQIMSGLLGAIVHPSPKRALVVGLGTGSTAGWLGKVPEMTRVDAVELEPAVVDVARACAPINENVLENRKVRVILGDAREVLLTTREKYDVVFSEPSNPYRAGVSSLYTREYYRAARGALGENGIFIQWMQGYEVDADALHTVLTTVRSVFDEVELWETMPGDFLVLAHPTASGPIDVARIAARLQQEPYKTAVRYVWGGNTPETVLSHFVATDALAKRIVDNHVGVVNTDDVNRLEFAYARSVGNGAMLADGTIRLARALKVDRPATTLPVDWDRVDAAWVLFRQRNGDPSPFPRPPREETRARDVALRRAYAGFDGRGNAQVLKAFAEARVEPTYFESVELARVAVRTPLAPEIVAQAVRDLEPATAELFLADQAALRREEATAVDHLVRGFVLARTSPWVDPGALRSGLALVRNMAERLPGVEDKILAALAEPFLLRNSDYGREVTSFWLAARSKTSDCKAFHARAVGFPWAEEPLRQRVACFERTNDPALSDARRELGTYLAQSPTPVGGR